MTFTTNHLRLAAELLIALLILIFLFRKQGCSSDVSAVTERGTADSTFYWKNLYGQAVASQKAMAGNFAYKDERMQHVLDSVAKVYDTKTSRIQELVIATVRGIANPKPVPGSVEKDVEPVPGSPDCPPVVKRMRGTFVGSHYLAGVQLGDSSWMKIQTYDTLTALWKTKKEGGLFNRKTYLQLDLKFADTSRVITGLTSYRKMVEPKQFAVAPQARLLYLDRELRPLAGLGLVRQTGRWNVALSAGKDFTHDVNIRTNGWWGEARLSYDLIRW